MTPLYFRSLISSGCFVLFCFFYVSALHHRKVGSSVASAYYDTLDRIQGIKGERLAYATFLAGTMAEEANITVTEDTFEKDTYFTAARLLGYHLMHKPSTRSRRGIPYVVLVTKSVPELQRERLRRDGAIVMPVEAEPTPDWFHAARSRWNDVISKLRLWEMEQFDRVVFLDVDGALVKPLDGVFDDPGAAIVKPVKEPLSPADPNAEGPLPDKYLFASVPEARTKHGFPPKDGEFRHGHAYFNAGFFMFSPSAAMHSYYASLTQAANVSDLKFDPDYPEQNLLNYAHRKNGPMPWVDLSLTWNIIRPTKSDVKNGLVSLHAKWWKGEELTSWFEGEVARMDGFYQARDEMIQGKKNGAEVPMGTKSKRFIR